MVMPSIKFEIGSVINDIKILEELGSIVFKSKGQRCWLVECKCGKEYIIPAYYIANGRGKSCGCNWHCNRAAVEQGFIFKSVFSIPKLTMKARPSNFPLLTNQVGKGWEWCTSIESLQRLGYDDGYLE